MATLRFQALKETLNRTPVKIEEKERDQTFLAKTFSMKRLCASSLPRKRIRM
jgi:hypothetical protein